MRYGAVTMMAIVAGLFCGNVWAQEPVDVMMFGQLQAPAPASSFHYEIGMVAAEPLEVGEPMVNAPYSADIVTEITQELADGNRIERRTTSAVARDGRGRVRREQALAAIGPVLPEGDVRMITINDPVGRVHYALDPTRKAAIRSHPVMGKIGRPGVPLPAPGGAVGSVMTFTRRLDSPEDADVRTERLGSKQIEGVRADGTRVVFTIPAGAIGNVRPIEVVNERWYSPELRVVVYSRRADPRFGETIYRLTNIVLAEPDPSLFQVPADYKQEEGKAFPFGPNVPGKALPFGPKVTVKPPM